MRIGLVAAMSEECGPLLRLVSGCRKTGIGRFRAWSFTACGHEIRLIRAGMGIAHAAEATAALISAHKPQLLLSFGFGGAVRQGLATGDLVLANRLFRLDAGKLTQLEGPDLKLTCQAGRALESHGASGAFHLHRGEFITTDRIENKPELAGLLVKGMENPLLDMETSAVALVASAAQIPFMAIRAVSDSADEELDFSIAELTDREMNVSIPRVLLTLARKPRILPQLLRLSRNSRLAGKNLATGIYTVLGAL
ncbi:MAG: nucleoside phosphorylase [Geobacteraceae bacterium]|nr:nucleoside phosphorylase [Geobacteraceae bacterium]